MKTDNSKPQINKPLTKSANLFPVVGIGASAGGLDAFKKLLKAIPQNSGMAFVLVQHLHPSHESLLAEILQKVTTIPVMEISDDIKVEPDHIYIIPSNKLLIANDGKLELSPRPEKSKNERNLPIDLFFTSLAEVHQSHAIGVVLSGTASDGTKGLKAIKDFGGITFAQDEASAEYDGMPQSAAQAGVVDFILPPEQIPQKLMEVINVINGKGADEQNLHQTNEDVFKQILSLLRIRKGTDFTYYKQTTIRRRILRRMVINKQEEHADYLNYVRAHKTEQDALYQDLLIPVTSFFRDTKLWDNLCKTIFPQLVKNKEAMEPVRIWVAGCSTGEEAYTMAICFKEFLSEHAATLQLSQDAGVKIQIFASDLSEPAITKARLGIYTKADVEALSEQRLKEFFIKSNGGYQVKKQVRDMVVFAMHNFLKDPPFGKMDLISCRNVLIYMEPYLQKKALTTFHYALNPKGFLWLGKSESISPVADLFTAPTKSDRLFKRKEGTGKLVPVASYQTEESLRYTNTSGKSEPIRTDFQKAADDIMLSNYTPAGVVINEAMDIVHFRGKTGAYLEQGPGKPSLNLIKLAKYGLGFEIRNILHKALKNKKPVLQENIPVKVNADIRIISIEAIPLPNMTEPHYLILFHDNNSIGNKPVVNGSRQLVKRKSATVKQNEKDLQIQQLEKELAQTREDMRSITEDQEAANEELQSANEELLSSSEELQSLNEELETSKEELQSTNEELTVINQELNSLNDQITTAKDYSDAIIANIHEALIVLDKNLRVKTANKKFYTSFLVNEQQTEGELIYNLGNKQWDIPELRTLLENILPDKSSFSNFEIEHHFQSLGKRTMLLNAREIRSRGGGGKLILLAIEDITQRKEAEKIVSDSEARFRQLVQHLPAAVYSCDAQGRITYYNDIAVKLWGRKPEVGKDEWCGSWKIFRPDGSPLPLNSCPMAIALKEGRAISGEEIIVERPNGNRSHVMAYPQPQFNLLGEVLGAINTLIDITELKETELHISKLSSIVESSSDAIIGVTLEGIITSWNKAAEEIFGYSAGEAIKKHITLLIPPELQQEDEKVIKKIKNGQQVRHFETIRLTKDRRRIEISLTISPLKNKAGKIIGASKIARDITEQKEAERRLEESEQRYASLAKSTAAVVWTTDLEGSFVTLQSSWEAYTGQSWEQQKGYGWMNMIHEEDRQKVFELWKDALSQKTEYHSNGKIWSKRHEAYRYFEANAGPLVNAEGNIKEWVGMIADVHDKKLDAEKIKQSEEQFRQLANLMPQKIWIADAGGNRNYFNENLLSYAGTGSEEFKDWGWTKFIHPDDQEETKKRWQQAIETGENYEIENRWLNKDGKYLWHLSRAIAVKDLDGRIIKWIGTHTEIQYLKEEEQRKGDFMKLVSHELKTPITSIKGYVQLLLSVINDKNAATFPIPLKPSLQRIDQQIVRLTRLIYEMLDLSRIDESKLEIKKDKINLNSLVSETVEDILYTSTKHKINLSHNFKCIIEGDKDRLGQVIINLITNAIKYSHNNRPIEVNIYEEDKNQVAVSIQDQGIGIDKNDHKKIFDRFYRADEAGKGQTYAGFGIGLFIAKEIIERHNGFITLESEPGKGAIFTFVLPFVTENNP